VTVGYQMLETERRAGAAFIWLNRPEVRNAFNDTTVAELTTAVGAASVDGDVRAIVIGGRGKAFCAGADLGWMKQMAGYTREENLADAEALARMLHAIYTSPKPVIARVQGDCYAGGIGIAAACDIVVSVRAAIFCLSETKLGLIPATIGPYVLRAIGAREASRFMLSAERFDALEAHRIGLVHVLADADSLDRQIDAFLGHFAKTSPEALRAAKQLIRDLAHRDVDDALIRDTAARIADARASADGREGVDAFLAKRDPRWCSPGS
jgi:methylglutaconyl-CoA hydratase